MNTLPSEITYKFGKKNFKAFLACEVVGVFVTSINFWPNDAISNKVYLIPLIAGPLLIISGFSSLFKSFNTPFCTKCGLEFSEQLISYQKEDEQSILSGIQENNSKIFSSIKSTRNDAKPRTEVIFEYCPACVEIGLVSVNVVEATKNKILKRQMIQGKFVRELKDALLV